jgi:hypothetical protein
VKLVITIGLEFLLYIWHFDPTQTYIYIIYI